MQEQRRAMGLDKADPVAVYDAYIGNHREQATFKILTSTGKIVAMGATMIDEKKLLRKIPTRASDLEEFIELENEVRDETKIYSYDGTMSGPVTDSRVTACPDVDEGAQADDDAAHSTARPATIARPQRQVTQAVKFDPADAAPQRKAGALKQPVKEKRKMMVPREMSGGTGILGPGQKCPQHGVVNIFLTWSHSQVKVMGSGSNLAWCPSFTWLLASVMLC